MQLLEVPAKEGYVWFRQGVWLFRKSPLSFLMLLFIYVITAQLAVYIPLIGAIAMLVATPGLSVGIMTACRDVIQDKRVMPVVLLAGFRRNGKTATRNLLVLGGIYAAMVFVLLLVAGSVIDTTEVLTIIAKEEAPTADTIRQVYVSLLLGATLYTPVAMLFWFAPMLSAWHDVPPLKALFFSWTACWRNRAAFFTYAVLFAVVGVAIPIFLVAVLSAVGGETILAFLITPYVLLMMAVLHCSFYATYRGCFNVPPPPEAVDAVA
jgi:hypothetical protein